MSLIVNEGASSNIPLLPEDVYPAVCCMLVDLGEQYSEKFGNTAHKVLISWELPGEKLDNGETRRLSNTYTASLNSKGNLRKDLISWRGRDFTVEELKKFDLRNIVGAPCMLSVIHKVGQDGNKRAVIGGIMKLPKGMTVPALSNGYTIFDLDEPDAEAKMADLPEWIQTRIQESETWKEMQSAGLEREAIQSEDKAPDAAAELVDIDGADGQLPF
ncbi:MAG: hypothetical protein IIZ83_08810 [Oscillospiraceae bacterium]|nr:hypothetical protein [Oscillospiraceae bacterium]